MLIVLEAPTPRAVRTGFVSMDNPDVASGNLRLLAAEAGLDRSDVVLWNLVPWCPPDGLGGAAFRAAHSDELLEGAAFLRLVLHTCPDVVWVVTLGKFARLGWRAGQPEDGIERPMRVVHAWNTRNRALISGNGRRREEVLGALREAGEWCGAGAALY